MKRKRLIFILFLGVSLFFFFAALPGFSAANVFDMPGLHIRHLQLLALMDDSHERKDFAFMETICRQGIQLGTADELWAYNLACALALKGDQQEALTALGQSIDAGFLDSEHIAQDPDLAPLRGTETFKTLVVRMTRLRESPESVTNRIVALAPDVTQTVMQTTSNTLWSFQMGLFHTFINLPRTNSPTAVYQGPEAAAINGWLREGSASGSSGLLYVNRDNDTQPLDIARHPGIARLGYPQEMIDRRLNIGLPNTLFALENSGLLAPVIGHSSMGYLHSPYWRSQPRAVCGDPRQATLQSIFLLGNQLFFYPAYGDYDVHTGDLFPANLPYFIAVAGPSNAERPFLEAAAAALAALRPETRAELSRTGLLMPTLNMLFRASQSTLKNPRDYLTGVAHPPVFQALNLDTARLVRMAHALTTNDLPPLVLLGVRRETQMIPDRDFFDGVRSEQLFDTPLAVARVFRGTARTRTLELQAQCKRSNARLHWVVLQGDPAKILFAPNPTNNALMTLTVAYHTPFEAPVGDKKSILTARVDIGVIAETASTYSMPSIVSFYFLGNEQRTYTIDGRIQSVDYTRAQTGYTDPLLSYTRNWKDVYQYDAQGNQTGWCRSRSGMEEERFTAYGHRIVASDARGRALKAHVVRYLPRRIRMDEANEGLPDLAQTDDNLEVTYRYASDSDLVGVPDLTTLKQDFQPPESAVSP